MVSNSLGDFWRQEPKGYKIILIWKRHDSFAILFGDGKEVFQHISHPLSEPWAEILEYEMRILFRYSWFVVSSNIVSKLNVIEGKINCWAMREVRDDQSVGNTTVFMNNNKIGDVVRSASFCKFFDDIISPIYSMRVWEYKPHFLVFFHKAKASGCRDVRTLANCNSFELGSLDVVIIIFGSCIPAREYSLSIWVLGSKKQHHWSQNNCYGCYKRIPLWASS